MDRKAIYNTFDPQQPPWEENVERFYVQVQRPVLQRLETELRNSRRPLKAIVPGHRGAGKSWSTAWKLRCARRPNAGDLKLTLTQELFDILWEVVG